MFPMLRNSQNQHGGMIYAGMDAGINQGTSNMKINQQIMTL